MTTGNDIDVNEYPTFKGYITAMITDLDEVYEQDLHETVKACRMSDIWNKHQTVWNSL